MASPATEPTTTTTTPEGPVLTVLTKRIRTLRKKLTRISQIELALSQPKPKPLNPEQLELVRSKPVVLALIDELDKLRTPLSTAIDQQIAQTPPRPEPQPEPEPKPDTSASAKAVQDVVKLMYLGSLFDVKQQTEFTSLMLTRTHERGCCLTYDYVTDDDNDVDLLSDRDLDLIANLQGLMIARPVDSVLSHKNAIESCFRHAQLWLENAHHPIHENSDVTYAALREKLNKIMSSDYFTATPHMKGPGEVAAAAAVGNFGLFEVPSQESMANVEVPIQGEEGSPEQQQQETEENATNYEAYETTERQAGNTEEFHKDELEQENTPDVVSAQTDKEQFQDVGGDHGYRNTDFKDQQYMHHRGSRGGRGGGRRGYPNGRGGRGSGRGNGPYQNGRNQYYDNNYPRNNNYYLRRSGRGGSGAGGGGYYNNGSSEAQGDHSQENIGVAS